jgi:ribosomal protein S18 acetylase RimI-like enzyme
VPAELRRVVPGDWPAVKRLRLEALADTPLGFLETHEAAAALPDDAWRARAVRGSEGGDSVQLLARVDGEAVGSSVTFPDADDPSVWWLVGVYLRPSSRGRGLLGQLVDALARHAARAGARTLRLQVHEANARARAAYRRLGFVETGEREPYPLGPGDELTMDRPLAPPADGPIG